MAADLGEDEFDIIRRYFAPLAGAGGLDLKDDVALLDAHGKIVTKDLLVAGTHFFADDPPDLIARKALRTNISDIVAKGGAPAQYFLGLVLPRNCSQGWIEAFAEGLRQDQQEYGCSLAGGDTTRHAEAGPVMISITMTGAVPAGGPVYRKGAQEGDILAVTGTIGDAGLGLAVRSGRLSLGQEADEYLSQRYLLPAPRKQMAPLMPGLATSALDVSDGLIADAGHLADASGLSIEIDLEHVPLSAAATEWVQKQSDPAAALAELAGSGDDYEILLTVPAQKADELIELCGAKHTRLTAIGRCTGGNSGVSVRHKGKPVTPGRTGYNHFSQ